MRTYHTPGVYFEREDPPPLIGPLRTDIAGLVGIAERGPLHTPIKIESEAQFASVFGGPIAQGYLAYAVDAFFANGGQTCWVVRVADPATANTASLDIVDEVGNRVLGVKAGSPGTWGNRIVARWIVRDRDILSITLHYPDGTEQMVRQPLQLVASPTADTYDVTRGLVPDTLFPRLITFERPDRGAPSPNRVSLDALTGALAGGADGLAALTRAHFTGDDTSAGAPQGLKTLEEIDEVSILAMPDVMPKPPIEPKQKRRPPHDCLNLDAPPSLPEFEEPPLEFPPPFGDSDIDAVYRALVAHCEKLRFRFAILETRDGLLPELAIAARAQSDSKYAAIYYPWVLVDDPLRLTGLARRVPPSGAVAGVFARTDRRRGVHKPPANEVVEGALDVGFDVDEVVHGILNDADVNVLRAFPGRGIRVYGARTVAADILWRYVNVRRLVSMIEKAIDRGTQWTVFEPNAVPLWREIDRVVRSYLETLFRQGLLDGTSSEEAYFVKCDESTNPPEALEGRVVCRIGVQPPYPAEFVVIVIGKTQNTIEVLRETGAIDA